jgi:hypothetical protein
MSSILTYCHVWRIITGSGLDLLALLLKLQPIITAHNQWPYDSLHTLLDHERLLFHCDKWRTKNHLRLNSPELTCEGITITNALLRRTEERPLPPTIPVGLSYSVFIRCYETRVNPAATLWFLQACSSLRNALLASRCIAMDFCVTLWRQT